MVQLREVWPCLLSLQVALLTSQPSENMVLASFWQMKHAVELASNVWFVMQKRWGVING